MFFTKQDRELLLRAATDIHWIKKKMATRAELNAALESENKEIQKAAERHQQEIADLITKLQDATNNLQAKHESDEDFSAELAEVNQHIATLQSVAARPLAATPPGTVTGPSTGAAGTTVGGAETHAAVMAAGAEEPEDPHHGSASGNLNPPPAEEKEEDAKPNKPEGEEEVHEE